MKKRIITIIVILVCVLAVYVYLSAIMKKAPPQSTIVDMSKIDKKGLALEHKGQWQEAVDLYHADLKQEPDRIDLWVRISDITGSFLNQPKKSAEAFQHAAELKPNSAEAWFILSLKWQNADNLKKALSAMQKANRLSPGNLEYLVRTMDLEYWLQDYDAYASTIDEAMKIHPNDPRVQQAQINLYSYRAQWPEAAKALERYFEHNPASMKQFKQYIQALALSGEYKKAEEAIANPPLPLTEAQKEDFLAKLKTTEKDYLAKKRKRYEWIEKEAKVFDLQAQFDLNRLPTAAMDAENDKKMSLAKQRYRESIRNNPKLWESWYRLTMIAISENNDKALKQDLEKLHGFFPSNSLIDKRLLNLYLDAKQYDKALVMINRNLAKTPNNLSLKRQKIDILLETKQYKSALSFLNKYLLTDPTNKRFLQQLLRLYLEQDKLDDSLRIARYYLELYPLDKKMLIQTAYINMWMEGFDNALALLSRYKAHYGYDIACQKALARLYSVAGRPSIASQILHEMPIHIQEQYDQVITAIYADFNQNEFISALSDLKKLPRYPSHRDESIPVIAQITTPFRSNIQGQGLHFRGSDSVAIDNLGFMGEWFKNPLFSLIGGMDTETIRADIQSGLTPVNGGTEIQRTTGWLGFKSQFSPKLSGQLRLGAQTNQKSDTLYYLLNANYRFNDKVTTSFLAGQSYYDASPKAVSLNIRRMANQLAFFLRPGLESRINFDVNYNYFSDGNNELAFNIYPNKTILYSDYLIVTTGPSLHFRHFSKDLNNGYYDPDFYQFYSLETSFNYSRSPNSMALFTVAIGPQRDNSYNFKLGNDVTGELFFGIYQDWYLHFLAQYSYRGGGALAANNAVGSSYRAYIVSAELTRRF